ncbi:probable ubiquitin--protein ligase [Fusarium mangiferae]|uniref:Probable ubiquitin--protein ligase n=1 Tax=Fusarium mangiferae TaxID=192010 RepID=A0A1L7TDP9_FUSMA|nr:putative ubiquitin--protein ligase [Fusarium mangiferae]CVK96724.1 probable ubiquitin--protein ligase [Fusarium mangiferae]
MSAAISSRLRRLAKELQDCQDTGVNLQPCNPGDLTHLEASLPVPPDTPYFGGTYTISVLVPDEYPFAKPSMKFNQKIYHPNVNPDTGEIAPGALGSWDPTNTMKATLATIAQLLQHPDSRYPLNQEADLQSREIPSLFKERAQEWAVKYAGAPVTETDSASYGGYNRNLIDQFVTLGYDKDAVVKAFEYVGIDRNNGEDYTLEEAYQGDILAKLTDG